jgi:hypothetical protein
MACISCCGFVRARAPTYVCVQRYILPRMFNIADPETERWRRINEQMNELRDSIKFVMDSVQQTLTTVQRREVDVSRRAHMYAYSRVSRHHQVSTVHSTI